jgi:antitoxin component HigA of HigAB toxin-antitoxin module
LAVCSRSSKYTRRKRWPIGIGESFDPIDVLHYAIDELGHTQAELAELLGSRSRSLEILSRRRALTVDIQHYASWIPDTVGWFG